jgi:mediator of RNA polymerase II transcription subunit 12
VKALRPVTGRPESVPIVLPEILMMAADTAADAPSALANGLWIKYRTSTDWAWKVWDNAIASLRQVPLMNPDTAQWRACALRYGMFLWQVDQHLPDGLDGDVQKWFAGPGQNEIAALTAGAWEVVTVSLLYLCIHGALKTTTILTGVVYPAWQLGATESTPEVRVFLTAANNIFRQLLLQESPNPSGIPPVDLFDVQCLQTRRRVVYEEPHFSCLVKNIPLLILLENKPDIPHEIRAEFTSLRHQLCHGNQFRQGAYRSLDVIRAAFEDYPHLSKESSADLGQKIIAGLRTILGDNVDGECQHFDRHPVVIE